MKKRPAVILVLLGMVFSMAACSSTGASQTTQSEASAQASAAQGSAAGNEIKFAVAVPLTGDQSEQGLQYQKACQLAVEEINAAGGINGKKLVEESFDDQASPNQAVVVAAKIVADPSIEFVIGHLNSGCTMAAMPTYINAGLAIVSPTNSMDELSTQPWKNYFRASLSDGISAKRLVDAIYAAGATKLGIFYGNITNDLSAKEVFANYIQKELGKKVYAEATYNPSTDRDFSSQVEAFKAAGCDGIVFTGEYTPAALFATQAHSKGYTPIMGGLSANNPAILPLGGKNVEGLLTVCGFDVTNTDPKVQKFVKDYKAAYGSNPNDTGSRSYDCIYMIADAYKNGATKDTLADYISNKTNYQGATMNFKFDGQIDNKEADVYILKIQDGAFVKVARYTYSGQ